MAILFKNNAASTLDYIYQAPDKDFVDIYVVDPTVFPTIASGSDDYFYLTLVGENALEIVKVFAQTTNVNTGKLAFRSYRAQEGTTAQEWTKGTRIEMRITAEALESFVPTAVQLAQDNLDAVGVASTTNVGFAGVDGKTTQADTEGVITAKDVALGGDASNLASARGFFYNTRVPYYPGIGTSPVEDFDLLTLPGKYHIVVSRDTLNLPGVRLFTNSGTNDGILEITKVGTAATVSGYQRLQQRFTVLGTAGNTWSRYQDTNATKWFNWVQEIRSSDIGDGIRITNTKLSVPEYEGATASTDGTAGLVPPAAAGQHESFLTGGGEYKPALTKISDSVNLADSKTAASTKSVKTVYDSLEALRLSFLGVPRYWRSTTLPANHVWANGDLALFADWPELKKIYDAGGFAGMLLAYNANSATIAANLGKWRPNAANPTGLYVPNLSEQFFRACTGSGNAGGYNAPGIPNITGTWSGWNIMSVEGGGHSGAFQSHWEPNGTVALETKTAGVWDNLIIDASNSNPVYGSSQTVMPASIDVPCIIYLGLST